MTTVAVDFDGVLAKYDGWKGHRHFGEPIEGAAGFLAALKHVGFKVIIFTTRGADDIREWLDRYGMGDYVDEINTNADIQGQNPGKVIANYYVDDRAVPFKGNWWNVLRAIGVSTLPTAIANAVHTITDEQSP